MSSFADNGVVVKKIKRCSRKRNGGKHELYKGKRERVVPASMTLAKSIDFRDANAARIYNVDGGVVPLQVMVENMRFAHQVATELLASIQDMMVKGQTSRSNIDSNGEKKEETLIDLYKAMLRMRSTAQSFAVDAAPYMHPRLAQVEIRGDESSPIYVTEIKRIVIDAVVHSDH